MHGSRYDVILLDLSLPDSDGAETYRRVRRPRVRGARRLLVVDDDDSVRTVAASVLKRSGYDEVDATRGLDGAALAGFLQKPFRPQELMQRIQDVLDA